METGIYEGSECSALPGEDEEFATEKVHESGGGYEHELGEEAGEAEPAHEKGTPEQASQEAHRGNGCEDSEFYSPGVTARHEDNAHIEQVVDEVGEGKGDEIIDDQVVLALGVRYLLSVDE